MSFPTYSFTPKTDYVDTISAAEAHRLINDATASADAGAVVRVSLPVEIAAAVLAHQ